MANVLNTVLIHEALVDYCEYGMPWKKSIRIRSNRRCISQLSRVCCGNHRHDVLRGYTFVDGVRVAKTSLASKYPSQLVETWSFVIWSSWVESTRQSRSSSFCDADSFQTCVDLNRCGAGSNRLLVGSGTARYSHIDDHMIVGSCAETVGEHLDSLVSRLEEKGFVVGSQSNPGVVERYVGYAASCTPARWTLPKDRLVKLHVGIGHFLFKSHFVFSGLLLAF